MTDSSNSLWYRDAVFYELYIRAYRDTNGDGHGDLPGVIEKLDYIKSLGVDCIWLLPMYPSPLKDDGYDVAAFDGIHPNYGTMADFERLIDEAHKRGLRIVADLIVNHTSDKHRWFVESRSSREDPRRSWYVWSDSDQRYKDARVIFIDTEPSNWAWDESSEQYYWHRFYASQPDLNYDNPEVRQAILDVVAFWLEKGLDGFRVDAVPYLFEREGTNCENLPETHEYLKELRAFVDARWPDALLLCEANQMPEDVVHYFGDRDEFHMGFHFPVMPRIYMALRSGQPTKLRQIMEATPPIPDACQWCIFLRNHDELTLEMVTEEEREWMWQEYAPDPRMRLNLGIRRRLGPLLDNDREKILLANRVLFSLPGAPIVYYGDEIGMGDNIWLPDRNGVRTPMQWTPDSNAGFSDAPSTLFYAPVVDNPEFSPRRVNVTDQEADPDSLLNAMRALISLRKQHPVFAHGDLTFLDVAETSLLAFVRHSPDETVIVVHNFDEHPIETVLPLPDFVGCQPTDLLTGREFGVVEQAGYPLRIGRRDSLWLSVMTC